MARHRALPVVVLAVVGIVVAAVPSRAENGCDGGTAILASGQSEFMCIDVNQDDVIDSKDCCWSAYANGGSAKEGGGAASNLCLESKQGASTPKLQYCDNRFDGNYSLNSDSGDVSVGTFTASFSSNMPSPSPGPATGGSAGNGPMEVVYSDLVQFGSRDEGSGLLL